MTKYKISIFIIPLVCMCLAQSVVAEVYYIGHSQFPNADHHLTLPQFVYNSSNFLTNDTQLIFVPGNYSLDSDILIENVHSFSMFVEPIFSSKAVIICDHNARFEFRNISIVTVSGLDLVGCFENHMVSIGRFQLENSKFYGQTIINGTVLTIDESTATLDRVVFTSTAGTNIQDGVVFINSSEYCPTALPDRATGVLSRKSVIVVTHSSFEGNNVGLGRVIDNYDSDIMIFNTTFVNNSATTYCYYNCCFTGAIMYANGPQGSTVKLYGTQFVQNVGMAIVTFGDNVLISHSKFINNSIPFVMVYATDSNSTFIDNINSKQVLRARNTNVSINYSVFVGNNASASIVMIYGSIITSIDHNQFTNNTGRVLYTTGAKMIGITHSQFVDNNVVTGSFIFLDGNIITVSHCEFIDNNVASGSLIYLYGDIVTVSLNEFINITVYDGVVSTRYYIFSSDLTIFKNTFIDNNAAFEVFINSDCEPGFSSSFGSPRCIKCPRNWYKNVVVIVITNIIVGIAIVMFMLALNMTVAVGTLNGILFYANTVAANADTYFFPFPTPNIITVFISWLNLDIGFDVCIYDGLNPISKRLIQLLFSAYIILLVIIVIVASEYSSKFAKIISNGNPVAVLATMILLSNTKFINVNLGSIYLLNLGPAYGSRNVDFATIGRGFAFIEQESNSFKIGAYLLIIISVLIFFIGIFYTTLITFWQCFVRYQDKKICKWVRYPKLRHFIEPYHAPYTAKYRYWTGLLLIIRVVIALISAIKFSFGFQIPVELLSTIVIIVCLLFLKGVTAKRVYKNWPLDVIETTIYFNLVAFSALTWYNLHSKENQVAVAYTSVMIIFILLLGVIVFHILRYTRLYKCCYVEKALKWISCKLIERKLEKESPNDTPEELDGYQLERPGDQELPLVTYSVVEVCHPSQNQEEENETAY